MFYIMVCSDQEERDQLRQQNGYNSFVQQSSDCLYAESNTSTPVLTSCNYGEYAFTDSPNTTAVGMNQNVTQEDIALDIIRYYIYDVALPIVFSLGIFGNIMNLVIFTRRRIRSRMSEVEKAATTGLMSLALADLCFCLVGLVSHFLSPFETGFSNNSIMTVSGFYYMSYKRAILNTLLFISTWVITVLSIERWAAATYPFLARRCVDVRRSVLINIGVYIVSIVFNIPLFLKDDIEKTKCTPTCWCYAKTAGILRMNPKLHEAYEITWAIVGTFVPIVLLVFCNIGFLQEINRSRAQFNVSNKKSSRLSSASTGSKTTLTRITVILVGIICMFLFLVCPSSILGFLFSRIKYISHQSYIRYKMALVVFNLTQAINFAANFLLYCTMSREFRNTLVKLVYRCKRCPGRRIAEQTTMTSMKANALTIESKIRDSMKEKPEWL